MLLWLSWNRENFKLNQEEINISAITKIFTYTTTLPTDLKFENYPRQHDIVPLRIRSTNPVELMPQVMFVSMVTHTTQVIVLTVSTFPPHPIYRLHATAFAHTAFMFYTWNKNLIVWTIQHLSYMSQKTIILQNSQTWLFISRLILAPTGPWMYYACNSTLT